MIEVFDGGKGVAKCLLSVDRDCITQQNELVVPLSTATSWSPLPQC